MGVMLGADVAGEVAGWLQSTPWYLYFLPISLDSGFGDPLTGRPFVWVSGVTPLPLCHGGPQRVAWVAYPWGGAHPEGQVDPVSPQWGYLVWPLLYKKVQGTLACGGVRQCTEWRWVPQVQRKACLGTMLVRCLVWQMGGKLGYLCLGFGLWPCALDPPPPVCLGFFVFCCTSMVSQTPGKLGYLCLGFGLALLIHLDLRN